MGTVVAWTFVALILAALTMVVAAALGNRDGDWGEFVADLRSALTPGTGRPGFFAQVRTEVQESEDETASLDELLTLGSSDGPAYVGADELGDVLGRASRIVQRPTPRQTQGV